MFRLARLIVLFLLVALFLPTALLLFPAHDVKANGGLATVYVNGTTGNDSYNGSSPVYTTGSTGPKKTIAAGLGAVSGSGTVNVAAGTYHEHGLLLRETMNLVGAGALTTIIDGDAQGLVIGVVSDFTEPGQQLRNLVSSEEPFQRNTISGFTIQNGAPYFTNPNISGFAIRNGVAFGYYAGGGIVISSEHIVTINDCAIINNNSAITETFIRNVFGDGDGVIYSGVGGGICNGGGVLYMNRCIVSGNTATTLGGGIFTVRTMGGDSGLVELTNCTISGNTVTGLVLDNTIISRNTAIAYSGYGGGIYCSNDATMRLVNVTIANNQATGANSAGGGFANVSSDSAYFTNCIVANNTAGDGIHNNGYDAFNGTAIHSLGYNIDSENSCYFTASTDQRNTNPLLGTLQNNGGTTSTHAIPANSPAFDRGTNVGAPATDQRGVTRPQRANCDIGAFELIYSVNTATGTGTTTFTTSSGAFTSLTAAATTPCGVTPAINLIFPYGFFSFTVARVTPGSSVTITMTFPNAVPVNAQYWKCINGQWVNMTSFLGDNDGDNVLTLTITDGGTGDADGVANGIITDPGGVGILIGLPAGPAANLSSESSYAPEKFTMAPAKLSVKYLDVQPQQAKVNQPVAVSANIANGGDEAGSYTATLKINGQVEEMRTGKLGGHAAVPLQFIVSRGKPGSYQVDVNGQQTSFTIVDDGSNKAKPTKDWALTGFILCAIGVIVVSIVLMLRRRVA